MNVIGILSGIGSFLTALFKVIPIISKWFTKTPEEKLKEDYDRVDRDVHKESERKRPGKIF